MSVAGEAAAAGPQQQQQPNKQQHQQGELPIWPQPRETTAGTEVLSIRPGVVKVCCVEGTLLTLQKHDNDPSSLKPNNSRARLFTALSPFLPPSAIFSHGEKQVKSGHSSMLEDSIERFDRGSFVKLVKSPERLSCNTNSNSKKN